MPLRDGVVRNENHSGLRHVSGKPLERADFLLIDPVTGFDFDGEALGAPGLDDQVARVHADDARALAQDEFDHARVLLVARGPGEGERRGLDVGVRVNVDVLNAQQQLSLTERDLARSRYDTLLALLKLRRAAGQLGESDLEEMRRVFSTP